MVLKSFGTTQYLAKGMSGMRNKNRIMGFSFALVLRKERRRFQKSTSGLTFETEAMDDTGHHGGASVSRCEAVSLVVSLSLCIPEAEKQARFSKLLFSFLI